MENLIKILAKNSTYKQIKKDLLSGNSCSISGLWGSSWAYFISTIAVELQKQKKDKLTVLFVTDSVLHAEECLEDVNLFMPDCAILLPPLEIINDLNIRDEYSKNMSLIERTTVMYQLSTDNNINGKKKEVNKANRCNGNIYSHDTNANINLIVASIQALMQFMPAPKTIKNNTLNIESGKEYIQDILIEWLSGRGFEQVPLVESQGEFSLKGCMMDIYPYSKDYPYRIEFFGDEVASIRVFDPETQISKYGIEQCQIMALKDDEIFSYNSTKVSNMSTIAYQSTLLTYLPEDTLIILKDEHNISDKACSIIPEPGTESLTISYETLKRELNKFKNLSISTMQIHSDLMTIDKNLQEKEKSDNLQNMNKIGKHNSAEKVDHFFDVRSLEEFSLGLNFAIQKLKDICNRNKHTIVFCNNEAEQHRFRELINDQELENNLLALKIGKINYGFQFMDLKITILTYNQIFKRYDQKRAPKPTVRAKPIDSFFDLAKGDFVVHTIHGIAKFLGIKEIDNPCNQNTSNIDKLSDYIKATGNNRKALNGDSNKREYLQLEFAEKTVVYVPATNIDLIQKYIGPSEHKPHLSKLGSKAWNRKKEQAIKAINDMAHELITLHAIRGSMTGIASKKDDEWQKEFEAAFIYQETEDQLVAAQDIKKDIQAIMPMDRLVCGDVGYGKTELAMRAAFKTVMNGRQVAVLVPTTILAQQHFRTFSERMADYPIKIDVLSRFRTKKEQKEILENAAIGTVDIVIGTHRLVQKDVHFKNIGLVIIDEEQKFGVEHKERLKKLRQVVDVLTLTATPIPRTLHMAMLGLRDISSLNTPPVDRKSIQTRIIRFTPELIRQIVVHELNRNGQVFFVHNRVYNIESVADKIRKLVPEARIVVGHGQMPEKLLESRMFTFVNGDADILVSTTIIESGLDIPNANTILINDADTFGLADLHQLRGRVGRYKNRAYAYLIIPIDRPITPEAEKKLKAIEEFSSLGAGFKIALRDLEIRGAGNFLGSEQHGHLAAIGYEMYCKLLETTVKRLKKEPMPKEINVSINIGLDAYLPNDYISNHALKMDIYRKLSRLQQIDDVNDIAQLLKDRFGMLPDPTKNLLLEAEVRIAAYHAKIKSLSKLNGIIVIEQDDFKTTAKVLDHIKNSLRFINKDTIHLRLEKKHMSPSDTLLFLRKILLRKADPLKY